MDQQEYLSTNIPSLFIRDNYACWSVRMKCYPISLGYRVWKFVEIEFKLPANIPTERYELERYEENEKFLNEIFSGLTQLVFVKFMKCKTTYLVWEKLKTSYEGASKVKQSKIQTYKGQFESLKIKRNKIL